VKEWINRTFKSAEAQENKDVSRTGYHLRIRRFLSPSDPNRARRPSSRRQSAAKLASAARDEPVTPIGSF